MNPLPIVGVGVGGSRGRRGQHILKEPLKCQTKIAADDILIFYFYLSKKIWLDFSCESSAYWGGGGVGGGGGSTY